MNPSGRFAEVQVIPPAGAEGIIIEILASQLLAFVADSSGVCVHVEQSDSLSI